MKRSASPFDEAPQPSEGIPFYSDNYPLEEFDWFALRLASTTPPRFAEPASVLKARRRIESARLALDHLRESGLSPIFGSFEFEALTLRGEK